VHAARAEGADLTAQIAGRPIGVMLGIGTALNPFSVRPSYRELDGLSIPSSAVACATRRLRRRILDEKPSAEEVSAWRSSGSSSQHALGQVLVMGDPPDSSRPRRRAAPHCRREDARPDEVAYDYLTKAENAICFFPGVNYTYGDHEPIREMLTDSGTLLD